MPIDLPNLVRAVLTTTTPRTTPGTPGNTRNTPRTPRRTMRRPRLGTIALLAGAAVLATWPLELPAAAQGPPQVIRAEPLGPVDQLSRITIVFDRPLAPLDRLGKVVHENVFRFEPKLDGRALWMNPRTLVYEVSTPPPPGTRIRYRLEPQHLRPGAHEVARDLEWSFVYQPPRLLAWHPTEASDRFDIRLDPVLLAFTTPPDEAGLTALALESEGGARIALTATLVPANEWPPSAPGLAQALEQMRSATAPNAPAVDQPVVIALTPAEPAALPAGNYRLRLGATLDPRLGSILSASAPSASIPSASDRGADTDGEIEIICAVPGPPRVLDIRAVDGEIEVRLSHPATVTSMEASIRVDPPLPQMQIVPVAPVTRGSQIVAAAYRIRGGPAGESVRITVGTSLVDAAGERAQQDATFDVEIPHRTAVLELQPASGTIIPSPLEFFRIVGRNIGPVEIRAAWIANDEMPSLYAHLHANAPAPSPSLGAGASHGSVRGHKDADRWSPPGARGWNLEDVWSAPADHPDSLLGWEHTFGTVEQRPHDAQALWVEALAVRTFGRGAPSDTLRVHHVFQVAMLGLQVKLSRRHGLCWVTDLATGNPVSGVDVSYWPLEPAAAAAGPRATPLWQGTTDDQGLIWTPGLDVLASLGIPRLALAQSHSRRVWLDLTDAPEAVAAADRGAVTPDGLRLVASVFQDRARYRPGETLYWKAYLRALDPKSLRVAEVSGLQMLVHDGVSIVARHDIDVDHHGSAHGQWTLPALLPSGTYTALVVAGPARETGSKVPIPALTVLGSSEFTVAEDLPNPWSTQWDPTVPTQVDAGARVKLSGRLVDRRGQALADLPLEWTTTRRAHATAIRGYEGFASIDSLRLLDNDTRLGNAPAAPRGRVQTDRDGRFRFELDAETSVDTDARLVVHVRPVDSSLEPSGGSHELIVSRNVRLRPVLRPAPGRDPATLAWEWGILDPSDSLTAGVPVVAELFQLPDAHGRERTSSALTAPHPVAQPLSVHELESASSLRVFSVEAPSTGRFALRLRPDGGGSATATLRASPRFESVEHDVAASGVEGSFGSVMPVSVAPDGRNARLEVPTPPGPAAALLTLENGELVRARVAPVRGVSEVDVPLDATVTTHAWLGATIVGADAKAAHLGTRARSQLPYRARAHAEISRPSSLAQPRLRLEPGVVDPLPGADMHLALRLEDASGNPLAGDATVWMVRVEDVPPGLFDPGSTIVDRDLGAVPTWDSRDALVVAPLPWSARDGFGALTSADTSVEEGESPKAPVPAVGHPRAVAAVGPPRSTDGPTASADASAPSFLPVGQTVYWNPTVPIGSRGRAQVGLSFPEVEGQYLILATAAAASGHFTSVSHLLEVRHPILLDVQVPEWIRPGDQFDATCTVVNRRNEAVRGVAEIRATGGGVTTGNLQTIDLRPGESTTWRARVESIDPRGRTGSGDAALEDTLRSDLVIDGTLRVETRNSGEAATSGIRSVVKLLSTLPTDDRMQTGVAAPRTVVELDLENPDLLLAEEVEIGLSPSFASLLDTPLRTLCQMHPTSTEEWISHAFGLLAWLRLEPYLAADAALAEARAQRLGTVSRELQARWNGRFVTMWSIDETVPPAEEPYLRGYLFWALHEIAAAGLDVSAERLAAIERSFHRDAHDSANLGTRWLNDLAFHTWLRAEYGTQSPRVGESSLEGLLVRQTLLGDSGRLYLGLAYDALVGSHRYPQQERAFRARINGLVEVLDGTAEKRTVLDLRDPHGPALFASEPDDPLRTSALGVFFFSRVAPNDALLPNLVHSLLDARTEGDWPNPHESAHTVWALREYIEQVEHLRLPVQARVVPGVGRASNASFLPAETRPRVFRFTLDELTDVRRRDRSRSVLPFSFETGGTDPLYFSLRIPVPDAEGGLPHDYGLSLTRDHVSERGVLPLSQQDRERGQTMPLRRNGPSWVRLFLSVPQDMPMLTIRDPLLPGCVLVGEVEGPRVAESFAAEGAVYIVLTDLPAGAHIVTYPIVAGTAGNFRVPAPQARAPYQPRTRGGDGLVSIEVKP